MRECHVYILFAPKLYHHEKKRRHIVYERTNADTITNFTNNNKEYFKKGTQKKR